MSATAPAAHEVTTPDGFPLAVQLGGPADGPPLLLLAGQANSHVWWDGLREQFEDVFRTITLDCRGTGGSRGPVAAWSTRDLAGDAACVLDALGIASAAVYGTSMGGRIAQWLAADRPDLVRALVLACTTPGGEHGIERSQEVRRVLSSGTAAERRTALHGLFYTPDWPHGPEESTKLGDPTMTREEQAAHLRASAGHDAWDALPGIAAPTLVLHGGEDLMAPAANAELLASRIPDARTHIVPAGRHGFFEEFAHEVTPAVRTFIAEAPAGV